MKRIIFFALLGCMVAQNVQAKEHTIDFTVAYKTVNFAGKERCAIAVNDQIPAPTLHFKQGDHVKINVHNKLDKDTAIHWHGIILPWQMDGVEGVNQKGIMPGKTFTYEFTLLQSGTYWYHAHAGLQEQQGLYGAFIIDPPSPPQYNYTKDEVIVLSDWSNTDPDQILANLKKEGDYYSPKFPLQPSLAKFIHDYNNASPSEQKKLLDDYKMMQQMRMSIYDLSDVAYDAFLLNGQSGCKPWTSLVKKGDIVRLRFIGAGGSTIFHVKIPGTTMQLVHVQGNDINPYKIKDFTIAPGETVDVLVKIEKDQPYIIYAESNDTLGAAYGALITKPNQVVNYKRITPFPEPLPVSRDMMSTMMMEMNSDSMTMDNMDMSSSSGAKKTQASNPMPGMSHEMKQQSNQSMDMNKSMAADSNMKMDHNMTMDNSMPVNEKMPMDESMPMDHTMPMTNNDKKSNATVTEKKPSEHAMQMDAKKSPPSNHKVTNYSMNKEMKMDHNMPMSHSLNMEMPTEPTIIGDKLINVDSDQNNNFVTFGTKYQNLSAAVKTNDPEKPVATTINMELFGYMERFIWFINGVPEYEAHPIPLEPGKRYRFIFTNSSMMHHPMHIHGHWFILRNGNKDYDPLLHTIDVPPGATVTADVDTDASGQWFFHCHMLYHMMTGMSRVFQYTTLIEITKDKAKPQNIMAETGYINRPIVRIDEVKPIDKTLVQHPMAHAKGFYFASFVDVGATPTNNIQKLNFKGLYGPDYNKLELFINDAQMTKGKIENADLDIFYWHLLSQFWAIKAGANYFYRPALTPYWQPGIGIEGLMPYFIDTDIRAYYYRGSAKLDMEFFRDTQFTNNFFLRLGVRGILATKTIEKASIGSGLNQMRYIIRPYYRLMSGLDLFAQYEYERAYGSFRRLQNQSGEATVESTITLGLAFVF